MVGIFFYPDWTDDTRTHEIETKLRQTTGGVVITVRPKEMNTTGTQTISMDPWGWGGRRSAIIDNWAHDFYSAYLAPAKNWRWYNKYNVKPEPVIPKMKPTTTTASIKKTQNRCSITQLRHNKRKQYIRSVRSGISKA